MNVAQAIKMITESPVLAKVYRADAVAIDGFGICTSINFDIGEYDSILEELYHSGSGQHDFPVLYENDVVKLLDSIVLELTVITEDCQEFVSEYSLKNIIESKVMDDGSVETPDEIDNDTGEVIEHGEVLKFYKLI